MAIIYSYPQATPALGDMVLGTKFIEGGGISTNSFYISDIVALVNGEIGFPTLQQVTGEGANTTIQMQINGVDVATVNDIPVTSTLQQVTTAGNTTTNSIYVNNNDIYVSGSNEITVEFAGNSSTLTPNGISTQDATTNSGIDLSNEGFITFTNPLTQTIYLSANDSTSSGANFEFPDKLSNTYTLATIDDIPTPAYKVYTALLTQAGTSVPIANVLESTLPGTVTFEYVGPGIYNAVLVGEFTPGSTTATLSGGTSSQVFKAYGFSADRVGLVTYDISGSPANNQMGITTLEIRVY